MDFAWDPEVDALRTEIRAFLAEYLPPALEEKLYTSGVAHDDEFARGPRRAQLDRARVAP